MKCPSAVKRDATAEISCKVMSKTFAVISWFYNGQPIKQLGKSHLKIDSLSCQQILKIKFAMSSDGGNYTCTVTNINSTITKTCHLVVKASKPNPVHIGEIKMSGGCKKACLGGSVNLICNMLDTEAFSWRKNDDEIRSERHVWKQNKTYGARGVKLYLEIINVTKSDEGLYECVGHKSGVQFTKALFLETELCPHELDPVSSPTEATGSPQFICNSHGIKRYTNHTSSVLEVNMKCPSAVKIDATVEISCEVMSKTFAVISWFYNGEQIKQLENTHAKSDSLSCQQKLKIKYAMSKNSENYTCTVTNINSTITKTCPLVVKEQKPDTAQFQSRGHGAGASNIILISRTRNRKTSSKRKVSGSPRVPFTAEQLAKLENSYKESHYVSSSQATQLSSMLKLPESRVKIWFQNRRAREKKKKTRKTISSYQADVETYFKKEGSCKKHREPGEVGWYPSHEISQNSTQYKVLPTATSAMCSGSAYWYTGGCNSKLCSPYNNHFFTIYTGLNLYL
ncbi:uncharacterized protein LOC141885709 isoform X3 [Acropora palmata]